MESDGNLQRWRPDWSAELPLTMSNLARLYRDLGLAESDADPRREARVRELNEAEVRALVSQQRAARIVVVHKSRRHFKFGEVIAEIAHVTVDGAGRLFSIAVESTDAEAVRRAADGLRLTGPNRAVNEQLLAWSPS